MEDPLQQLARIIVMLLITFILGGGRRLWHIMRWRGRNYHRSNPAPRRSRRKP